MNKQEFLSGLERMGFPKTEYIILSGGSLLMRGLREKTEDYDLCASKKLAERINLYSCEKDEAGCYVPFQNVQMKDDFDNFSYDVIDGYQCETLEGILAFKRRMLRPKDIRDIAAIEAYLKINE